MQFVQYGMLGALAALVIPIIIHLMFRRQARPVDLGTLQFLKIVLRDNTKKRRIKRYLLLALRMAGVALIAFLFARPYMVASEAVDGSRSVVVLVDRSASMGLTGGERPIDRALTELKRIVAQAGPGTQLEVAGFDRVVSPFGNVSDATKKGLEPSSAGTDDSSAMAWARDLSVRSKSQSKELHILTDLQRVGLDRGEAVRIPNDVEVHLTDLGRSFPKNIGVTAVSQAPESIRPRESATVTAVIRNASPFPIPKVPVRLHLEAEGNEPINRDQTIDLDGDASMTVEFKLSAIDEGLWRGYVEVLTSDDLGFDNRRYLGLGVLAATRVLLLDGDPGRSSFEAETFFLKAALKLASEGESFAQAPFDPRTIDATSDLPDLSKTTTVVLANVANLPTSSAKKLAEFVERGGGLVVFTGDRMTPDGVATLLEAGLGVGKLIGPATSPDRPWRLETWDATHPIFRPFADPEFGDLRRPTFTTITKVVPDLSARVLASFRGGEPSLIERKLGQGTILWFLSACDRDWGDWPRGRLYLPMIHQFVSHASGLAEGGRVREELAGELSPGAVVANGIVRVVNVDPDETETARCTPKEFADRFGFKVPEPKAVPAQSPSGNRPADDRLRGDEIWPWLGLALVGVLMLEQFLANRTAA